MLYARTIVHAATKTAVALAWGVLVFAIIPLGPDVSDSLGRLAVPVAGVGSMHLLIRHLMAPAHELFCAGKMLGRLEALQEERGNVTRLEERRALRSVSKS